MLGWLHSRTVAGWDLLQEGRSIVPTVPEGCLGWVLAGEEQWT